MFTDKHVADENKQRNVLWFPVVFYYFLVNKGSQWLLVYQGRHVMEPAGIGNTLKEGTFAD